MSTLKSSIDDLESKFSDVDLTIGLGWHFKFRPERTRKFSSVGSFKSKGNGDSALYFSVEGVGKLEETEESFGVLTIPKIVQNMQSFPESFYLESPLYWKLKSALESIKLDSHSPSGASLNGVPDYFYDMAVALRRSV